MQKGQTGLSKGLITPVTGDIDKNTTVPMPSIDELLHYKNTLTNTQKDYLINGLEARCQQLDQVAKSAFKEVQVLRDGQSKNLNLIEDTLTFIKTSVANCYGATTLAIKNLENEVSKNGNKVQ